MFRDLSLLLSLIVIFACIASINAEDTYAKEILTLPGRTLGALKVKRLLKHLFQGSSQDCLPKAVRRCQYLYLQNQKVINCGVKFLLENRNQCLAKVAPV